MHPLFGAVMDFGLRAQATHALPSRSGHQRPLVGILPAGVQSCACRCRCGRTAWRGSFGREPA